MIRRHLMVMVAVAVFLTTVGFAQEDDPVARKLGLEEFLRLAITRDTEFESILIDELTLEYEKDLRLPARDLVLSVRSQYNAYLSQDREDPRSVLELSKLFPLTGTEVTGTYSVSPSFSSGALSSQWGVAVSQPVARNAFGRTTRLLDQIIGVETEVARHQIVEAYEDYLAQTVAAYDRWYEAWENLKIGESSYQENVKLLDNIKERQTSSIALPIDVNKITLQVLARKESLIDLRGEYEEARNVVLTAIRAVSGDELVPINPGFYDQIPVNFEEDYRKFRETGRTFQILQMLKDKTDLEVDRNAGDLLPSINLLFGYDVDGDGYDVHNENNLLYGGIELEWPLPDQVSRADYEVARVNARKADFAFVDAHFRLFTELKNLFAQMDRSRQLAEVAQEKIRLAGEVLRDESENYTYGKVTLNDYIQAVNQLDSNRFTQVRQDARRRTLLLEWLRLTDQLVDVKKIQDSNPGNYFQGARKDTNSDG